MMPTPEALQGNLRYRVARVRLWGGPERCRGVQLVYREYRSGQEVDGEFLGDPTVGPASEPQGPAMEEFELVPGEFLTGLEGREDASTTYALAFITSARRRLGVGSDARGGEVFRRPVEPFHELRGLTCWVSGAGAIQHVTALTAKIPRPEGLDLALKQVEYAYREAKTLDAECYRLMDALGGTLADIKDVAARGIVYPVIPAVEFADIAWEAVETFRSCRNRLLLLATGGRQSIRQGIAQLQLALIQVQELITRFPIAEIACLTCGDDDWAPEVVRERMLRAMDTGQYPAVAAFYAQHAPRFTHFDLHERLLGGLLQLDDVVNLRKVMDAFARATDQTLPMAMSAFRSPPSLIQQAVYFEKLHVLEWLVTEAQMDPCEDVQDGEIDHCRPEWTKLTPLQLVERVQDATMQERMRCLLVQIKHRREFQTETMALAGHGQITYDELAGLVPKITSVYDLQPLYTFGMTHLSTPQFRLLLLNACEHVMKEKLVLDDHAAVFFKMALKQSRKNGCISPMDYEKYNIRNVVVHMEAAEWVREIKQNIQKMQWHVANVEEQAQSLRRNFLRLQEAVTMGGVTNTQGIRCAQMVSLISIALFAIGGPVFTVLHGALNLAEPLHLFLATVKVDEKDVGKLLEKEASDGIALQDGVERVLENAGVDAQEFVSVLKRTVALAHPDFVDDATTDQTIGGNNGTLSGVSAMSRLTMSIRRLSTEDKMECVSGETAQCSEHDIASGSLPTNHGALSLRHLSEISEFVAVDGPQCDDDTSFVQQKTNTLVSLDEASLEDHPYHFAVFESKGDLKQFVQIESWFQNNDGDVNDIMDITVKENGVMRAKPMTAHVFASYLGYTDIVHHLLNRSDLITSEKSFVTLRRAQRVLSMLSTSSVQ